MGENRFIYSLALILISQIPFLVKLWLDYRSRRTSYRDQLFTKQMDAYIEIYRLIHELQSSLLSHISYCAFRNEDDSYKDLMNAARGIAARSSIDFSDAVRRHEMILPSTLIERLSKYDLIAAHITIAGEEGASINNRDALQKVWEEQILLYNFIINDMRQRGGTDRLSAEISSMLQQEKRIEIVIRNYKASA